jgi:hypothetical protein
MWVVGMTVLSMRVLRMVVVMLVQGNFHILTWVSVLMSFVRSVLLRWRVDVRRICFHG